MIPIKGARRAVMGTVSCGGIPIARNLPHSVRRSRRPARAAASTAVRNTSGPRSEPAGGPGRRARRSRPCSSSLRSTPCRASAQTLMGIEGHAVLRRASMQIAANSTNFSLDWVTTTDDDRHILAIGDAWTAVCRCHDLELYAGAAALFFGEVKSTISGTGEGRQSMGRGQFRQIRSWAASTRKLPEWCGSICGRVERGAAGSGNLRPPAGPVRIFGVSG